MKTSMNNQESWCQECVTVSMMHCVKMFTGSSKSSLLSVSEETFQFCADLRIMWRGPHPCAETRAESWLRDTGTMSQHDTWQARVPSWSRRGGVLWNTISFGFRIILMLGRYGARHARLMRWRMLFESLDIDYLDSNSNEPLYLHTNISRKYILKNMFV